MTIPCEQKEAIARIENNLESFLKVFNGNGKIGLAAKVETLWSDRTSRNNFIHQIATWSFRALITWLVLQR